MGAFLRGGETKVCVGHLSIGALTQHFEQLELRRVGLLTALLHVVADVDLLQDAVILREEREMGNTKVIYGTFPSR